MQSKEQKRENVSRMRKEIQELANNNHRLTPFHVMTVLAFLAYFCPYTISISCIFLHILFALIFAYFLPSLFSLLAPFLPISTSITRQGMWYMSHKHAWECKIHIFCIFSPLTHSHDFVLHNTHGIDLPFEP